MTKYKIVNADTPEAEAVEKPVEFTMQLSPSGYLEIHARQLKGWIHLAFVDPRGGRLYIRSLDEMRVSHLPALRFDSANKWETYQ